MGEHPDLERFRAELAEPTEDELTRVRASVEAAIRSGRGAASSPSAQGRTTWLRRTRLALAGALAAGVAVAAGVVIIGSDDRGGGQADATLRDVAATIQASSAADYEHLADRGWTLQTVAADQAEIVGIGRVVEVREAYREVDRFASGFVDYYPHLLLVIEPQRLAKGADLLGDSGLVMVDIQHPYLSRDQALEARALEQLRNAVASSDERVALMLDQKPRAAMGSEIVDEFAGRAPDDPLLWPAHPSSLFGLDEERGIAFSMTTDEVPDNVGGNVGQLRELGATIDRFGRADGRDVTTPSGA